MAAVKNTIYDLLLNKIMASVPYAVEADTPSALAFGGVFGSAKLYRPNKTDTADAS